MGGHEERSSGRTGVVAGAGAAGGNGALLRRNDAGLRGGRKRLQEVAYCVRAGGDAAA